MGGQRTKGSRGRGGVRQDLPSRKRKVLVVLVSILVAGGLMLFVKHDIFNVNGFESISIDEVLDLTSERRETGDMVVASSSDPFYPIIATPLAVWYDVGNRAAGCGLKPFLVVEDSVIESQRQFIEHMDLRTGTVLGDVDISIDGDRFETLPPDVSVIVARHEFHRAAGAVVVDYNQEGYEFAVSGTVLASYLNVPVLLMDKGSGNRAEVSRLLSDMDARYIIALGKDAEDIGRALRYPTVVLDGHKGIRDASLKVVNDRFGRIDYMVVTNPSDVVPPSIIETKIMREEGHMQNLKLLIGGNDLDLSGASSVHYDLDAPSGPVLVKVWANVTNVDTYLGRVKRELGVDVIASIEVRDVEDKIVAYSPSFAHKRRSAYVEFLVVDCTKTMDLEVSLYYGTKGLSSVIWGSSGYSKVDADFEVVVETSRLEEPHWPLLEGASTMGPYLAAAHGGIVLAGPDFEMTDHDYATYVSGMAGGPWYEWEVSFASNIKAAADAEALNKTIESMGDFDAKGGNGTLFDTYTGEHGWLAILGDTNMIPFYYHPKLDSWEEDPIYGVGWPGDTIYNYNGTLSPGRLMGSSVADISTLVARTLFYQDYALSYMEELRNDYPDPNDWADHYGLLYGEGGGQTGGVFWQDPYTVELEQHGWAVLKYGNNLNNDRQTMEVLGAYRRANYFEIMLHGNWYWYVPELNGADSYSTAVKVTDVNNWDLGPTVFLTAACLMGRIDGVPPETQISLAFIHAGVNAVYSATRSTGQESSTREIERNLLYNDTTVGEALRDQKNWKPVEPTLYVRILFGDPAFNPYEPENGFSEQGRPVMIDIEK